MLDTFTDLKLTAPPGLEEALGYAGNRRGVVCYWTPIGDERMDTDGETKGGFLYFYKLYFMSYSLTASHKRSLCRRISASAWATASGSAG